MNRAAGGQLKHGHVDAGQQKQRHFRPEEEVVIVDLRVCREHQRAGKRR